MKRARAILLAVTVVGLGGCDNVLGLKPEASVPASNFYKTEQDMTRAVSGVYSGLQTIYGTGTTALYVFAEMRSDNTTYSLNPTGRANANTEAVDLISVFDRPSVTPATDRVFTAYQSFYSVIKDANVVLNRINDPNITFANDSVRVRLRGEAYFIRGLMYLNLVRLWGGVPLVTQELSDATGVPTLLDQPRASVDSVYAQVIADADSAYKMLWTKPQTLSGTVAGTTGNAGRATKGAAKMLAAKAWLDLAWRSSGATRTQRFQRVITELDALDALSGYGVVPDYASIFQIANKNTNAESIFEVQFSSSAVTGGALASNFATAWTPQASLAFLRTFVTVPGSTTLAYPSNQTGGGTLNIPTPDLALNAYEKVGTVTDKRKDASIFLWHYPKPQTGTNGYTSSNRDVSYFDPSSPSPVTGLAYATADSVIPVIRKFTHSFSTANQTDDNFPVFRYSDAVLMRAEALNELGDIAGATTQLNRVRVPHSGLPALTTPADQESFRVALLKERRAELAFENQRWFDLTRIRKGGTGEPYALSVMTAHGADMRARTAWSTEFNTKYSAAYQIKTRDLLLPFPAQEILRSKAITDADQNPGYE